MHNINYAVALISHEELVSNRQMYRVCSFALHNCLCSRLSIGLLEIHAPPITIVIHVSCFFFDIVHCKSDCIPVSATCNGTICGGDMAHIIIANDPTNMNISTDYCVSSTSSPPIRFLSKILTHSHLDTTLGNFTLPINATSGANNTEGNNVTVQCGITPNNPNNSDGSSTSLTIAIAAGVGLGVLGILFLLAASIVWRRQNNKDKRMSKHAGANDVQSLPYDRTVSTPSTLVGASSTEKFINNRPPSSASSYFPKTRSPLASREITTPVDNVSSNRYQRRPSTGRAMDSDSIPLTHLSTTPSSSSPLNPFASLQPQGTSSMSARPDSFFGATTLGIGIDAMDALVDGMGSYASSHHSYDFEASHANSAFVDFDQWNRPFGSRPQSSAGGSDGPVEDS